MTDFAVIVPTRDRPEFFQFCKWQLDQQTIQPTARYYIAYKPTSPEIDLVKRIKSGVELAKMDGIDVVYVIEDDDALSRTYFERTLPLFNRADFVGDDKTYYYNIFNCRWSLFRHPGRSSLFTTAFRISALQRFKWPPDNEKFLDMAIWKFATKMAFTESENIGIKHSIGMVGGKGHKMRLDHPDPGMLWLKKRLEPYQVEFYEKLRKQHPYATVLR